MWGTVPCRNQDTRQADTNVGQRSKPDPVGVVKVGARPSWHIGRTDQEQFDNLQESATMTLEVGKITLGGGGTRLRGASCIVCSRVRRLLAV